MDRVKGWSRKAVFWSLDLIKALKSLVYSKQYLTCDLLMELFLGLALWSSRF